MTKEIVCSKVDEVFNSKKTERIIEKQKKMLIRMKKKTRR